MESGRVFGHSALPNYYHSHALPRVNTNKQLASSSSSSKTGDAGYHRTVERRVNPPRVDPLSVVCTKPTTKPSCPLTANHLNSEGVAMCHWNTNA